MKYLVDSDFLISFSSSDDSNHLKAVEIYQKIRRNCELVILNLVIQESTTVVSKRFGMNEARSFFELVNKFVDKKIKIDNKLEMEAWKVFLKQNKKGTSFIDCANLALCQKYNLDGILSFDEFYPKAVRFV